MSFEVDHPELSYWNVCRSSPCRQMFEAVLVRLFTGFRAAAAAAAAAAVAVHN